MLSSTRDHRSFFDILLGDEFSPDEVRDISSLLDRIISFLYHEVRLDGIHPQADKVILYYNDWPEYLSKLHRVLAAVLGKLLDQHVVYERVKQHQWKILSSHLEHIFLPNDYFEHLSVYQLLELSIQHRLLYDTLTLNEWCSEWHDPKLLTRCLAACPQLDDDPFSSALIEGCLFMTIINECPGHNGFRPGAHKDVDLIDKTFAYAKDATIILNDLSRDDLVAKLDLHCQTPDGVLEEQLPAEPAVAEKEEDKESLKKLRTCKELTLCLSSHGNQQYFVCNDGKEIEFNTLFKKILHLAPELRKLYILVQACQGTSLLEVYDENSPGNSDLTYWCDYIDIKKIWRQDLEIYCLQAAMPGYMAPSSPTGSLLYKKMYNLAKSNDEFRNCWIQVPELFRATLNSSRNLEIDLNSGLYTCRPIMQYYSSHHNPPWKSLD